MKFLVSLVFVGLLWGGTNPLIKKNSKDIVNVKGNSKLGKFLLEIKYLVTNYNVSLF